MSEVSLPLKALFFLLISFSCYAQKHLDVASYVNGVRYEHNGTFNVQPGEKFFFEVRGQLYDEPKPNPAPPALGTIVTGQVSLPGCLRLVRTFPAGSPTATQFECISPCGQGSISEIIVNPSGSLAPYFNPQSLKLILFTAP